jgi:hypothetical protein
MINLKMNLPINIYPHLPGIVVSRVQLGAALAADITL